MVSNSAKWLRWSFRLGQLVAGPRLNEMGGAWKWENLETWRLGSGPRVAQGLGDSSLHW